jgi:hypothetical protein
MMISSNFNSVSQATYLLYEDIPGSGHLRHMERKRFPKPFSRIETELSVAEV